jgi:DNA polymerase II small subunit
MEKSVEKKKNLVKKLVNAGINATPSVIDFVMTMPNPSESLEFIIKETSFIPTFKSHLTLEILNKISNDEIQKALKRAIWKKIIKPPNNEAESIDKNQIKGSTRRTDDKSEIVSQKEIKNTQSSKTKDIQSPQVISPSSDIQTTTNSSTVVVQKKTLQEDSESSTKVKNDISTKIQQMNSAKSQLRFNPLAKEYDPSYKIKMDPTGKLFTSGEYDDFYDLAVDKYNQLYKLMRKRPETQSAINIGNILKFNEKTEISTIGLVNDYRQTKNGHYFFVLEDLTGAINVLVRKDSELFNTAQRTINDQMLFVQGEYSPGKKGKSGIIFASAISKIDVPTGIKPNLSPDPLSIMLVSDTHIGSREFEEKLWKKFIDFLNGRLGNQSYRESAGKVKYIIINGDLIDGIGVYPNQEQDLVIGNLYKQFEKAAELLSQIPDYITIFYSSGNHEPVRNAIPRPAVPKKYCQELVNLGVKVVGNPCLIETHNVNSLVFHGDSLLDLNLLIPGLDNNKPVDSMRELLKCRHLAPAYGNKTQIAPTEKDWLVIDKIPEIFHCGHLHINGLDGYRNVQLVNSGCFQTQTDYMRSFGINPTPGQVPLLELDTLHSLEVDFKKLS